jgi:hypothetical protein
MSTNNIMSKTHKNGRGSATRGWKKEQPGFHQRTIMLKKCGKKCFLGPEKKYPICKKNTCKISSKGVYSAYIRARQYHKKNISRKAKKMLENMGAKR